MTSCFRPYDSHSYWDWLNNSEIHDYKDPIYIKHYLIPILKYYTKKYKHVIDGVFMNYKLDLDKYAHIESHSKILEQYIKDKYKQRHTIDKSEK